MRGRCFIGTYMFAKTNPGRISLVRYGIETETLHEEGVRIQPGSARWDAFWSAWPAMAEARAHWLIETAKICLGRSTTTSSQIAG